jgi:hypothetical protein
MLSRVREGNKAQIDVGNKAHMGLITNNSVIGGKHFIVHFLSTYTEFLALFITELDIISK